MLTFLFWNIAKRPIGDLVAALAEIHQVDVLLLAECSLTPAALLGVLNSEDLDSITAPHRRAALLCSHASLAGS
jgi:hypothetical protein